MDSYGRQKKDIIKGATVYRSDNGGESWTQVSGLTEEMKPLIDGAIRLELYKDHQELFESSSLKDAHWQYLGPTNISGRATDVEAVRPRAESYIIYAWNMFRQCKKWALNKTLYKVKSS
ncbi:hypothetical protein ES705_16371 [subsurface metagenome]